METVTGGTPTAADIWALIDSINRDYNLTPLPAGPNSTIIEAYEYINTQGVHHRYRYIFEQDYDKLSQMIEAHRRS
jgi:hypothetical protein